MKIDINRIPTAGLIFEEILDPLTLDLDTGIVKFSGPITVKADVSKITNVVTAYLELSGLIYMNCSRCLNEFEIRLQKALKLNYTADNLNPIIDLTQDIREEMILAYPIKPLCKTDCKGLCAKCGRNLNEGDCVH